jgi:hypothetical protein
VGDVVGVAVWERLDGSNDSRIRVAVRSSGAWGGSEELSEDSGAGDGDGDFAPYPVVDNNGKGHVAWQHNPSGGNTNVQYEDREASAWDDTTDTLSADNGENNDQPHMAARAGKVAVAWEGYDGVSRRAQVSVNGTTAKDVSTAGLLRDVESKVFVAIEPGAPIHAVFAEFAPGKKNVRAATSTDNGANWSSPAGVSSPTDGSDSIGFGTNASGKILATFRSNLGAAGTFVVQANHYDPATGWGAVTNLSKTAGNVAFDPRAAVDAAGNGVATWERDDLNGDQRIEAITYDGENPVISGLSVPAGGTAGQPVNYAASVDDTVSSTTTRQWNFGDGSTSTSGGVGASAAVATSHTYAAPGTYTVTLTATDQGGNSSTSQG